MNHFILPVSESNVNCLLLQIVGWRDGLVVSALVQRLRVRRRGFESAGCGLSYNNSGPVALCTLGLGLLNPPSSRGR